MLTHTGADTMPSPIDVPTGLWQLLLSTRPAACALCLGFAAFAGDAEARTIKNAELNYTLVVPDRFKQMPPPPGAIDAFASSDPAQGIPDAVVTISRLPGVLGREHFDASKHAIPGFPEARFRQQKWKTFDIDVMEAQTVQAGVRLSVRGAQIPLKPAAIQLSIAVRAGKEAEADALLTELLAGLDGPSNWLTDFESSESIGQAVGGIIVLAVALLFGIRAWRKRSRRSPD
jgi:hypothetical protein